MYRTTVALVLSAILVIASLAGVTLAGKGGNGGNDGLSAHARLTSSQEVPAIVSNGGGIFRARMSPKGGVIGYTLRYETVGEVAQAHIHVGQPGVNGGISAFLCTNLGNGSAGVPACPETPGEVSGEIVAADIVGPASQGVDPGDLRGLISAMRSGIAYVNVHSDIHPSGELRGRVRAGRSGGRGDRSD